MSGIKDLLEEKKLLANIAMDFAYQEAMRERAICSHCVSGRITRSATDEHTNENYEWQELCKQCHKIETLEEVKEDNECWCYKNHINKVDCDSYWNLSMDERVKKDVAVLNNRVDSFIQAHINKQTITN